MKRRLYRFVPALAALTGALLFVPRLAHAQVTGLFLGPLALGAMTIAYVVKFIIVAIINVEAWCIELVLFLNTQVVGSPAVKAGFPVVLSLANVAFVLAIVVIAIATIVRSQNYGIKRALFRLVVMAIFVNFGLVFAGAIVGFSDNLTIYWLNGITGNSSNPMGVFSTSFTGIFQPQQAFLAEGAAVSAQREADDSSNSWFYNFVTYFVEDVANTTKDMAKTFSDVGAASQAIMGSVIGVFVALFTAITLFVFILMLLVRYIYLSILLVLLPLAWAGWIFPSTSNLFSRWWDKFIKQAFFAPIVVFFLWLAIQVATAMKQNQLFDSNGPLGTNNPTFKAAGTTFGPFAPVLLYGLQAFISIAFTLGGLMAAESMSIKFAGAGISAAKGAAKGFGGYVNRRVGGAASRYATREDKRPAEMPKMRERTGLGKLLTPLDAARYSGQMANYGLKSSGLENAVRKATVGSDFAEKRGWTEKIRQYGTKTDAYGKDSAAQKAYEASKQEKVRLSGLENTKAATEEQKKSIDARLATEKPRLQQESEHATALAMNAERDAKTLEEQAKTKRAQKALAPDAGAAADIETEAQKLEKAATEKRKEKETHEQSAGSADAQVKALEDESKTLKSSLGELDKAISAAAKSWVFQKNTAMKMFGENSGIVGSPFFGALEGGKLIKGGKPAKMALPYKYGPEISPDTILNLAKSAGVEMPSTEAPVAAAAPAAPKP